jgi:hypothetical protein
VSLTCAAKAARWCGDVGKGCTEPEELQSIPLVHARARSTTPQIGPHWTATRFSQNARAADACSTLWDKRENSEVKTLEGRENLACFVRFNWIDRWKHGNILSLIGRDGMGGGHSEDAFPGRVPPCLGATIHKMK